MADLQIARRGEQPLERDQLVPQLGELVREGRAPLRQRRDQLVPASGADGLAVPRVDRARERQRAHAVNRRQQGADLRGVEPRDRARRRRPIRRRAPTARPRDRSRRRRPCAAPAASARRLRAPRPGSRRRPLRRRGPAARTGASRPSCPTTSRAARPRPAHPGRPGRAARQLHHSRTPSAIPCAYRASTLGACQPRPSVRSSAAPMIVSQSMPKCA